MTYGPRELVDTIDGWVQRGSPEQSDPSAEDVYIASLEQGWGNRLDCLTPKQRFVIELRCGLRPDGRDHTLQEVAELMGISHQAVRKHERRAKEKLRVAFGVAI